MLPRAAACRPATARWHRQRHAWRGRVSGALSSEAVTATTTASIPVDRPTAGTLVLVVAVVVVIIFNGCVGSGDCVGLGSRGATTAAAVVLTGVAAWRRRRSRHGPRATAAAATIASLPPAVGVYSVRAIAAHSDCFAAAAPVATVAAGRANRHIGGPTVAATTVADVIAIGC